MIKKQLLLGLFFVGGIALGMKHNITFIKGKNDAGKRYVQAYQAFENISYSLTIFEDGDECGQVSKWEDPVSQEELETRSIDEEPLSQGAKDGLKKKLLKWNPEFFDSIKKIDKD